MFSVLVAIFSSAAAAAAAAKPQSLVQRAMQVDGLATAPNEEDSMAQLHMNWASKKGGEKVACLLIAAAAGSSVTVTEGFTSRDEHPQFLCEVTGPDFVSLYGGAACHSAQDAPD